MKSPQSKNKRANKSKIFVNMARRMPQDWGALFAAFGAICGFGYLTMLTLPFVIGASINTLGLSVGQAGLLGSVEFSGIMIASLVAAPFMARAPRRRLAIVGALMAIAGNGGSILIGDFDLLLGVRALTGLGCGLALACGNATVANSRNPELMAAHVSFLFVLTMVITALAFAEAGARWGHVGIFGALTLTMALLAPLLLNMPARAVIGPPGAAGGHGAGASQGNDARKARLLSFVGISLFIGFFFFSLRDIMQWSVIERIGVQAGLTSVEVGGLISIQAVAGLMGPVIAARLGARLGLALPVLIGIAATGLVTFATIHAATEPKLFVYAVSFNAITYFFAFSYLTALAAALDNSGKIAAASGSFVILGAAVAPLLAGAIVERGGYAALEILVVGVAVLTAACMIIPLAAYRAPVRP